MKDPAFLLYSGDFATGTQFFTDDQVGKYVRLLIAQHLHGHLSERQMLHICKSYDEDIFLKFLKDDEGKYYNERLESEVARRKKYSESRSENKKGRKHDPEPVSTKKSPKSSKSYVTTYDTSYDNHMETETEIEIETIINLPLKEKKEFSEIFKRWTEYKQSRKEKYKSKDSLVAAFKKLVKLSDSNAAVAAEIIEDAIANNYAGFFALKNRPDFNKPAEKNKLTTLLDSANRVTLNLK